MSAPFDPRRHYRDEAVVARYDADRYGSARGRLYLALHHREVRRALAALPAGATVLDVPCGTGRLAPLVAGLGLRHLGLDVSPAMARHCRNRQAALPGPASVAVADIDRLPLADASVDAVLCIKLFHLIDAPAIARALRECARVARRSVVADLARRDGWTPLVNGVKDALGMGSVARRGLAREEWAALADSAGLRIVRCHHVLRPLSAAVILTCRPCRDG